MKAKRKKTHHKKRTHKKSGLFASKAGRRKTRRKSGGNLGLEGWKGALLASGLMRAVQGAVGYFAATQNMGQELPKVKMIVPAAIAFLAKNGVIPVPGMFPAAVASLVDSVVDNTQVLKDVFDFKFMSAKPKATAGLFALPDNPRETSGLFLNAPMARSGINDSYGKRNPVSDYMQERMGATGYQR